MTTYLTLAEVQAILCYRSRNSAAKYIRDKGLPWIRRRQAILVERAAFEAHLESKTMNEGRI